MWLLCMHGGGHCYHCVVMYKLMMLLLGFGYHAYMLVIHVFIMHVSVCMDEYACSVMVMIVLHKFMV